MQEEIKEELLPNDKAGEAKSKLRVLNILKYPEKSLLQPSREVKLPEERDTMLELVKDMVFTMRLLPWGVPLGLAAPQIGENVRLFIAEGKVYINPRITWETKAPKTLYSEGCYSLEENRFDYKVYRAVSIRLAWQDFNGDAHEQRFNGKNAQIILHELDHLDGVLCHDAEV